MVQLVHHVPRTIALAEIYAILTAELLTIPNFIVMPWSKYWHSQALNGVRVSEELAIKTLRDEII